MISIHMLKICGKSIVQPLLIISKKCLEKGYFQCCFKNKQTNKQKKNDKQLLKSYRPIFLLPICSNALERYSITQCLRFSSKITWLLLTSLVLRQVTCASTNLFTSVIKYTNHLMMPTKYRVYLLIYWQSTVPRSSLKTKAKCHIQ